MYGRSREDLLILILSDDFQPDNVPFFLMNLIETCCYLALATGGCGEQNRMFIEQQKHTIGKEIRVIKEHNILFVVTNLNI